MTALALSRAPVALPAELQESILEATLDAEEVWFELPAEALYSMESEEDDHR